VKLGHAVAVPRKTDETIVVKQDKEMLRFDSAEVDEIVEARLEEIFDAVAKELKKAGRAGQLPSGVVLTGGSAKIRGIAEFAKAHLGLAARVGKSSGYGGVAENIEEPQFAAAVGLMLQDAQGTAHQSTSTHKKGTSGKALKDAGGFISKFLDRFKA
jgi:cell division protein FtsA